jgi:hypothetical protein
MRLRAARRDSPATRCDANRQGERFTKDCEPPQAPVLIGGGDHRSKISRPPPRAPKGKCAGPPETTKFLRTRSL